ncbi:hypothetical protein [Natrinema gelatinilyticum]|uniref:hypothetical protein n=1 Tax=Natrinema gelatinilyticum TaxID=2961571 RepID=UPI0020C3B61D|nr:hypothetical protein [Natrinema gelatinilyticum]
MHLTDRQEDLLIAVALTEFSVHYEAVDLELSQWAWQLAADRFVEQDIVPREAVDKFEIGDSESS